MAAVKRVAKRKPTKTAKSSARATARGAGVELPTTKSTPSNALEDYTWLIYGEKKIGKTSLVSHFPNILFCMFEPGGKALSIFQTETLESWESFLGYVSALEKSKGKFKNVCIDPGNQAYDRCLEYVCRELGIEHPGTVKDYGASWKKVAQEFQKAHVRIAALDLGFIVLAHSKEKDIEQADGPSVRRIIPVMSGSTEEFYAGVIDVIGYYHYIGRKRFLQIRGDDLVQAGTRCEENFLTTSGEPIIRIPMGTSSKEAYANLVKAFNNEQTETYAEVNVKEATTSNQPKKRAGAKKKVARKRPPKRRAG